jgi:glycosyltransferase involved in cell wall biosynthesis
MISVVIPAHNEAAVMARSLRTMLEGAEPGEFEVVVVCNGCTDDTAARARSFAPDVRVLETEIAGKTHALNLGDQAASAFPRIYVDADVLITADALRELARRLEGGRVLAVAPKARPELTGCSRAVRAFYAVRALLPSAEEGIGGSGVYAVSAAGRKCFGGFPDVIADDGFVRIQFHPHERATLSEVESVVFPPRTLRELIAVKTRSHHGSFELAHRFPAQWMRRGPTNHSKLLRLFSDPRLWTSLIVYCFVMVSARRRARQDVRRGLKRWERDCSSRLAV